MAITPKQAALTPATGTSPPLGLDVIDWLIEALELRRQVGLDSYGSPLRPFTGDSPFLQAFQESLDQTTYLAQAVIEAETIRNNPHDACDSFGTFGSARDLTFAWFARYCLDLRTTSTVHEIHKIFRNDDPYFYVRVKDAQETLYFPVPIKYWETWPLPEGTSWISDEAVVQNDTFNTDEALALRIWESIYVEDN